ncbi:translocation/assembly module TamB domain-containing protein [Legionella waltersii]|uniref:Periplasmic protein n=1 Tax=Legionella waltersii TaxID=66969 RepID=A0A0W1AAH6_9GAMM|nr:translocation/assembly module TamB domain-containing protein [Legionella waltersii]KTD78362.1 periplasmic protein [Legionella waltersii]SNV06452.1 periplasmic protein [Legionella waltersii]
MSVKRLLKKILYCGLMTSIVIICLLSFFLTTTPGLYLSIKLSRLWLPGSLSVSNLNGRLVDEFTIGQLIYKNNHQEIRLKQIKINWQFLSLMHKQLPINHFSAKLIQFNPKSPLKSVSNIHAKGIINKEGINLSSIEFNYSYLKAKGRLRLQQVYPYALGGKFVLTAKSNRFNSISGNITLNGNLEDIQWTGSVSSPATLSMSGSLQQLTHFKQIIKWNNLLWKTPKNSLLNSPNGRIEVSGTLPTLFIQLNSKINVNAGQNWQLKSSIHGVYPWNWSFDANLLQPLRSSKQEGLYSSLILKGSIQSPNDGDFTLTISPGHYRLTPTTSIPFEGTVIKATLTPKQFAGQGQVKVDSNKLIKLSFSLPKFKLNTDFNKQALIADATLQFSSIDFLQKISPYIQQLKGELLAQLKARGTLSNVSYEGSLALKHSSMNINALGVILNPIELIFTAKNGQWNATGSIESSGKKLHLNGKGLFTKDLHGDLSLQGDSFTIANTKEYQIQISPNLQLGISPSLVAISGEILVPEAHINPHAFTNSLSASEDIVFTKNSDTTPISVFNTSMNIKIALGDTVELTFKGLHALLNGSVVLNQLAQGPITAKGELNVTKGEYKAYAQDLHIEQGQLLFTGGKPDNPGISLRASKQISTTFNNLSSTPGIFDLNTENNTNFGDKISAGVEVTGRLQSPKIQLFSNPPSLSQADILSLLVLGRPASQANKAGGQLLLAAISSMNLGTGTNGAELVEQLKQKLGFDVNVQSTSNYNQATKQITDTTGVVVGKTISNRVYVSYNVGLSQSDPNILTLKYLLNKFLSIQISSSDSGNGVDVVYTSAK